MSAAHDSVKTAFAFPGVGVRPSGHETDFYGRHASVMKPFLEEASGAAGSDLVRRLLDGTIGAMEDGKSQLFTYAFCCGFAGVLEGAGIRPAFTAGYSFGIYAALQAAGAVTFGGGLEMVLKAFELMSEASRGRGAGMGVVVGLSGEDLAALVEKQGLASVRIVNSNSELCKVLSGERKDLGILLAEAKRRGAVSTQILEVDIPYHHPALLRGVSPRFMDFIKGLDWKKPRCPVVSSIDQALLEDPSELARFASANLSTPISWQKVVETLAGAGVARIVECGPGLSLTQNGRFIPGGLEYVNTRNVQKRLEL
jgi:[acyl-carrier-protein] S-malonyltransferase